MNNYNNNSTNFFSFAAVLSLFLMSCNSLSVSKNKQISLLQEPQSFSILNTKDTIIATKEGVMLYIRKGTFLNSKGLAFDTVKIEVKEAFSVIDALANGLVTKSADGQFLQTGGMLFLDATTVKGELLEIAANKNIKVEIPLRAQSPSEAQLYMGSKEKDYVVWQEPKPLEERKMVIFPEYTLGLGDTYLDKTGDWENRWTRHSEEDSLHCTADSIGRRIYIDWHESIDHLKGLVVKYENTWIMTREFGARAHYLNRYCLDSIAIIYFDNINKKLWEVDEMAYQRLKSSAPHVAKYFKQFAEQKCTVIEENNLWTEPELINLQKKGVELKCDKVI